MRPPTKGRPLPGRPSKRGKGEAAFRGHLTVYLCVGLFLFTLNILTSPFELWFYWPLFFWGWALVFQAVATYGAEAPTRVLADLRAIIPWLPKSPPPPAPAPAGAAGTAPFAAAAFASVHERIERLKETAWQIPEGPVRDQAHPHLRRCRPHYRDHGGRPHRRGNGRPVRLATA